MKEFKDKMDGRIVKMKMDKALDMLRTQSPEQLKKRFSKKDVDEAMQKLKSYDSNKFNDLGIDMKDLQKKLTDIDMQKIKNILGKDGDAILRKIKDMMK